MGRFKKEGLRTERSGRQDQQLYGERKKREATGGKNSGTDTIEHAPSHTASSVDSPLAAAAAEDAAHPRVGDFHAEGLGERAAGVGHEGDDALLVDALAVRPRLHHRCVVHAEDNDLVNALFGQCHLLPLEAWH